VPVTGHAAAPSATTHTKLQRELDRALHARLPGAVLFARDGSHTVLVASGYAEVKHKTRMRTSDRFRVGNITTSFVATVVLQLVARASSPSTTPRKPAARCHRLTADSYCVPTC
jgi:D-alanyl-D-alanine carboxypeptidase